MVTSEARTSQSFFTLVRRIRWIHLAPVLALMALSAWAFASPVGAGPDDDYHIVSTWCASGGTTECTKGSYENSRIVPEAFRDVSCYAQDQARSAECQSASFEAGNGNPVETTRGNFAGEYPPVYYATMHLFAGSDLQVSALAMRLFNVVLFVGLATALAVLLPAGRRQTLLWGWLITLVPLGVFLIPSNNPSGWAIVGIGTAFLALLGWFESEGGRRWALGAIYVVGMIMVAGARGDAAIYAVGATVTVLILTAAPNRAWALSAVLPVAGVALAVVMFAAAGQSGVGLVGFTGGEGATVPVVSDVTGYEPALSGSSLAAYNLLMLPFLWTGVWGAWGLGWLDTQMPAIVAWAAVSAFVVVAFAGLGRLNWRKAISVAGTLLVLVALPVYVLTVGGDKVGANLQPRYLLPLIVLFAFLVIVEPSLGGARGRLRFTRLQTFVVFGALAIANLVALQVNIRRYVTGADQQGANLDAGAEWWWTGFPVGPTAVWLIGAIAYAGLLVLLWPELRRKTSTSAVQPALSVALRR